MSHKPKYDYLKYWRVVRYWAQKKYNIGNADLDVILYLYSEGIFSRKEFRDIDVICSWDKGRFYRLIREGWINVWRDKTDSHNRRKLYELSLKGKRMCASIYKKLLGEEKISESRVNNPIFGKASYSDKLYRTAIRKMNAKTAEQ